MNDGKHIIWTDYLDYDDWKADFEAQYPELSENERMNLMYEINGTYFQDWCYTKKVDSKKRKMV